MSDPVKNDYLEQVQRRQEVLEDELKVRKRVGLNAEAQAPGAPAAAAPARRAMAITGGGSARQLLPQPEPLSAAVDVRITGWWRWKKVLVPPNAYVVHTREGVEKPLHLGLGISFPYNPYSDSFLVVPGAMQTILINAYCICRELQGLLVQGYVQWIVGDFATAYKKLDFSDAVDPMKVVNVQLREQAEAAIKDKVATMGIDEVLSDKQPIIQELTARLRAVAEGAGESDKGLGLRIVTVQIKEAVVSSGRLWENLQKPFRSERERVARLAELNAQQIIQERELEHHKAKQTTELTTNAELDRLRSRTEAETFDREQGERARREARAQEVARQVALDQHQTQLQAERSLREVEQAKVEQGRLLAEARQLAAHQQALKEVELNVAEWSRRADEARAQAELETARARTEASLAWQRQSDQLARADAAAKASLAIEEAQATARQHRAEVEIAHLGARQRIENDLSPTHLQAKLIAALPEVASKLPHPTELRTLSIEGGQAGGGALGALVAQVLAVVKGLEEPRKE